MIRVALLALAACASAPLELEDMPCPDEGTPLTYDSFARDFFDQHCDSCHTTGKSGAPSAYRFDSHARVLEHADRIFIRAAGPNVTMPPGPDDPPADERERLAEWLACGAP